MTKDNRSDFRSRLLFAAKVILILVPTLILVFGSTGAAIFFLPSPWQFLGVVPLFLLSKFVLRQSLIESLVITVVVAVLIGLLIPLIQTAKARRATTQRSEAIDSPYDMACAPMSCGHSFRVETPRPLSATNTTS
jgi:hypothetical protein